MRVALLAALCALIVSVVVHGGADDHPTAAPKKAKRTFYVPGVKPMSYSTNENVPINVNSLTSHSGVMPFPFYSFKQCAPDPNSLKKRRQRENLGQLLWGNQIEPSLFEADMQVNVQCRRVCDAVRYTSSEMKQLAKLINGNYRGNLVMDNLPVAQETKAGPKFPKILLGYPLGVPAKLTRGGSLPVINNHLHLRIVYHEPEDLVGAGDGDVGYRIVGFYATAHSVQYTDAEKECDGATAEKPFKPDAMAALDASTDSVTWTYSVSWVEDPDLPWATRWDVYLRSSNTDDKIHWASILNSVLAVLFLSAVVATIMLRALRRDVLRYNADEKDEETGWKLVHGDVFRAPPHGAILAALVGSGAQLSIMALATLSLTCVGFLSPSQRGALLTAPLFIFAALGVVAGYVSARMLKFFGEFRWRSVGLTAILVPGCIMGTYFVLNFIQWGSHASSAVPFAALLVLFSLWLLVSAPLVFVGASVGNRRAVIEAPCKVNVVPRLVPDLPWYERSAPTALLAALLPFGAAFIELIYILTSLWQGRVYYVFGFLAIVSVIVCITTVEVAIVVVYLLLCRNDHRWWWPSFASGAGVGLHTLLFALYYLRTSLGIRQPTAVLLYLGYMSIVSSVLGVMLGSSATMACFYFVRKMYGAIRID